jgi:hypothetical protein
LDVPNSSSTLHVPRGNRYFGILLGESYIGIRALADLFLFAFKIPNNGHAPKIKIVYTHIYPAAPTLGVRKNMPFSTQKSISYTRRGSTNIVRFLNKCSKIVIYLFSKFIVS